MFIKIDEILDMLNLSLEKNHTMTSGCIIMHTFWMFFFMLSRKTMAMQGEHLQVVPDIDNGDNDAPLTKKPCDSSSSSSGAASSCSKAVPTADWELKLHQPSQPSPCLTSYRAPRSPLSAHRHPPVRLLSHDAQPLSSAEAANFYNARS